MERESTLGRLRAAASAIGDSRRFRLVLLLLDHPHTVQEITRTTGWNQPLVSHHLAVLCRAGVTDVTREGRFRRYRIASPAEEPIESLLALLRATAGASPSSQDGTTVGDRPAHGSFDGSGGEKRAPVSRPNIPEIEDYLL